MPEGALCPTRKTMIALCGLLVRLGGIKKRLAEADIRIAIPHQPLSMSALPPIADINGYDAGCPLLTQSGHRVPRVWLPIMTPYFYPLLRLYSHMSLASIGPVPAIQWTRAQP